MFLIPPRYTNCNLTKYLKQFNIMPKQSAFGLLKKFLTMDPKRRITSIEAIQDIYLREPPELLADAFSTFPATIPFPLRKYLPAKNQNNSAAVSVNDATDNNKVVNSNGTAVASASEMQYSCKSLAMPVTNVTKYC